MTNYDGNGRGPVRVDETSLLARYADWRSRTTNRLVAAIGPPTTDASVFVADEVIVDGDDPDLVDELISRHGAERVRELPLPEGPARMRTHRHSEGAEAPEAIRLRFVSPPRVDDAAAMLERVAAAYPSTDQPDGDGPVVATSEMGASVAALAARYSSDGRPIGLNLFGDTLSMPLSTAIEGPVPGAGANPFVWPAFAGPTRMVQAWQLIDSIRQVRGDDFTTLAVLDRGFWLDSRGVPMVAPGQPFSDFGNGTMQVNLQNEGVPAGGMGPGASPWHGNAVTSAASATVNNAAGAAGAGGTVSFRLLFQTDISIDQMMRCARICAAWGVDVLNMSIGTWGQTELWFPTSTWNKTFQFASDNGVVMIAAAGNDALDLPDDRNIRPATRTPGVLTVGALDTDGVTAWSRSNHGSSVWLWAPGVGIPVAPDQASPAGSTVNGTSFAAPMVAGVAAMMRYANDALTAADVRRILVDTGWPGAGRVSRGLDAYAAVLAAINRTLPDSNEPNNTPASARELIPTGPGGSLVPGLGAFTARSSTSDTDFWKFRVDRFSMVTLTVDWYERLSSLVVFLEAEDPDARGPEDMVRTGTASGGQLVLKGLLPPGVYRILVGGSGATAYRLLVARQNASLTGDIFEDNDSFETAAQLRFQTAPFSVPSLARWGPGTYDATLHQERALVVQGGSRWVMDDDYFKLVVPAQTAVLQRPTVAVFDADQPLDVVLYDEARQPIGSWIGVRSMTTYPPVNTVCFLKVSGSAPTRYRIMSSMTVDFSKLPGPLEEELQIIPDWWGDPPALRLGKRVTKYALDLGRNQRDDTILAFENLVEGVRVDLLDLNGQVVRMGEPTEAANVVDIRGLDAGPYVVRLSREDDATGSPVQVRTLPPLGLRGSSI